MRRFVSAPSCPGMDPVRPLPYSTSSSKLVSDPSEAGMAPESRLSGRCRVFSLVSALKSGMAPLNWFDNSPKISKFVKALKVDGMLPVNRLPPQSIRSSLVSRPRAEGMVPERSLPAKCRMRRFVSALSCPGMDPVRLLPYSTSSSKLVSDPSEAGMAPESPL